MNDPAMYLYPLGDLGTLYAEGLTEAVRFLIGTAIVMAIYRLTQKYSSVIQLSAAVLTIAVKLFLLSQTDILSELFLRILLSATFVLILQNLRLITSNLSELLFLFACFLTSYALFNSSYTLMGYGIEYLSILAVLFLYGVLRERDFRSKLLYYYISFICLSVTLFLFDTISSVFYAQFRQYDFSPLFLVLSALLLASALYLLFYLLHKRFEIALLNLSRLGGRYPGIENGILWLLLFDLAVFLLLPTPFLLTRTLTDVLIQVLAVFYLILFLIQIIFIALLYRMTDYRHTIQYQLELQNDTEKYTASFQHNMNEMANLRHDIKNIFLTMNNFVERSSDEEMKAFYRDKIYPFAADEIEKNYLYSELLQIPSEPLRAFLYLKLFQGQNKKENIRLSISLSHTPFEPGMDLMDLTRILGILLDNAFEECEGDSASVITLQIKNSETQVSYSVKNTINPLHSHLSPSENQPGKSSKSGHSGRGLVSAHAILDNYPQALLNTYSDGKTFLQTLVLPR